MAGTSPHRCNFSVSEPVGPSPHKGQCALDDTAPPQLTPRATEVEVHSEMRANTAGPASSQSTPDTREPPRKCVKCGGNTVRLRMRPGRTIHYRNITALAVPETIPIPTCSRCHAEYIDEETASALERALQEVYSTALRQRAREAIDILTQHSSQRRLELLLGLSQGYLCRIKEGKGQPSATLCTLLGLLSLEPELLRTISDYWAAPGWTARD